MAGKSRIKKVEYHRFAKNSISSYTGFKVHFKELIEENLNNLIKVMDEIEEATPSIQDKKSSVRNNEVEENKIVEIVKELVDDTINTVKLAKLTENISVITKNFNVSAITSFDKAYEFVSNLKNTIPSYEKLKPLEQRTKDIYNRCNSVISKNGLDESGKKNVVKDVAALFVKWDMYYASLKYLIKVHFIDDEAKYKSFFMDLKA